MNEKPDKPNIAPELEARFVALVLGEASDFEREQLEQLTAENPQLAELRDELERVHGLLGGVTRQKLDASNDQDWKLSSDRRKEVLSVIGGEESVSVELNSKVSLAVGHGASAKRTGASLLRYRRLMLGFGLAGCLAGLAFCMQLSFNQRRGIQLAGGTSATFAEFDNAVSWGDSVPDVHVEHDADFDAPSGMAGEISRVWEGLIEAPPTSELSARIPPVGTEDMRFGRVSESIARGQVAAESQIWQATQGVAGGLALPALPPNSADDAFASLDAGLPSGLADGIVRFNAPAAGVDQDGDGLAYAGQARNFGESIVSAPIVVPDGGNITLGGIERRVESGPTSGLSTTRQLEMLVQPRHVIIEPEAEERYGQPPAPAASFYRNQFDDQSGKHWAMRGNGQQRGYQAGGGFGGGGYGGRGGDGKSDGSQIAASTETATGGVPVVGDFALPTDGFAPPQQDAPTSSLFGAAVLSDETVVGGKIAVDGGSTNGALGFGFEAPQQIDAYSTITHDGRVSGVAPNSSSALDGKDSDSLGQSRRYKSQPTNEPYLNFLGRSIWDAEASAASKEDAFVDTLSDVDRASIAIPNFEGVSATEQKEWEKLGKTRALAADKDAGASRVARGLQELDAISEQLKFAPEQTVGQSAAEVLSRRSVELQLGTEVAQMDDFGAAGELERLDAKATPRFFGNSTSAVGDSARNEWYGYIPPSRGRESAVKRESKRAAISESTAAQEPFSTFSLHVSDVSFKLAASALAKGEWPKRDQVRIEEFVAAFDYGDPMPSQSQRVGCSVEQCIHPFQQQRNVLRIAMRTAAAGRASQTPLRLTLLLDNSGSMERYDRRQTLERALGLLAAQLQPNDQVTLISFANKPRLLADRVSGADASKLTQLVSDLPSEGGTNIEAALKLAWEKAREQFDAGAQNRIVLLTDGAVNLGDADPAVLARSVEALRQSGIAFDAAGIIADGLNDEVLEALTRKGDGRYYLLDSAQSADDSFARQIAGALRPAAKNVKVQVEFNPDRVGNYKLLGFEKHILKKEDFRNDAVDAAEMAAAEAGVAVYQFEPKPDGKGDVGFVSVRFQDLSTGQMVERRWPIPYDPQASRTEQSDASMQVATAAAMFAAKLRGDPVGESVDLAELASLIANLPPETKSAPNVAQLQTMIEQARELSTQ